MIIEVPMLPPREYSLNSRCHWAKRYRAGRDYRTAVFLSCFTAGALSKKFNPFQKARLELTFVFAQRRTRDRDNLIAQFKPGLDELVDVGLLPDDDAEHLELGEVNIEVDKNRAPLTIIELMEMFE